MPICFITPVIIIKALVYIRVLALYLKKQFDPDVSGLISIDYQESTSRQQFRCF